MDGQMNKPDWLRPGALVKVQHWCGIVEDVAVSPSAVMVLIRSAKGIWRNQRNASEWLEYIDDQIVPIDETAFLQDVEAYRERINQMLADLEAFERRAQEPLAA